MKMFGEPEDIRVSNCGVNLGKPWKCTFWKYGDYSTGKASFTFYEENGKLFINSFDVDR